jgi:4'-phosphopantetheinyl transferase
MHQNIPERFDQSELAILTFEVNPSKERWTDYIDILPTNEVEKSEEYHYSQDKLHFTKCRSILRKTLSKWLDEDPTTIGIKMGRTGKPQLDASHRIKFSITHTKGFAGIAFCKGFEVGLDVESSTRVTDFNKVSKKVFTDSEQMKISSNSDIDAKKMFFRFWTAKEAFLKNTGHGLTLDPKKIEAHLPEVNEKYGTYECPQVRNSSDLQSIDISCPEPYIMTLCASKKALGKIGVYLI